METLIQTPTWTSQVLIRQITRDDLPALEWEGTYTHFRTLYADAMLRQELGYSVLWAAELSQRQIIGQVFIQLVCDRHELADGVERAYLFSFRVRPEYRCAGVGLSLLQTVMTDLRQRNFQTLTLNVAKDNLRARKFYERNAFRVVAHEPGMWSYPDENGVWHQVVEPAWRMERAL